jgi:enoyl-CoA hydratase
MSEGQVRFEVQGDIAVFTLDAPASRNALTPRMLCQLADHVVAFAQSPSLRVAILTGSGDKAFCAGGDLARTLPLMSGDRAPQDAWDHRVLDEPLVMAASGLRDYPLDKPVIAAVNGACMAAGFEILLGTDIRLCAEHATFALPEVKRALIPFAGSLARLPRQIPQAVAMELMLTGDAINAAEAQRLGLVNRVLPAAELMPQALALAAKIARNGPVAVQAVKRTVVAASGLPLDQAYRLEDEAKARVMASADAREGPRAFMEKREPVYRGQ